MKFEMRLKALEDRAGTGAQEALFMLVYKYSDRYETSDGKPITEMELEALDHSSPSGLILILGMEGVK